MFSTSVSPSKCVTEPALEVGTLVGVADREDVRRHLRLQRVRIGGDEAELVAEPGRAADVRGAAVQRDRDQQVEGDLALVPADEPPAGAVDLAGGELGHQRDALLGEQPGEMLGGDGLGERAVERRDVGQLDVVADAALAEVPVGQEAELERRDRALDRHVDRR